MDPQTFLINFGHVANAPDGVKSLRQLIMASALAGRFSAPNEELPSGIHKRLEESRSRYFRSIGKQAKALLFASPLIHEFEIPIGWQWVRVGQICHLQTGATPSTQRAEFWGGEIPWLASGDVNRREIFGCEGRISDAGLANSNCKILPKDSVLIALNGQGKTRATVALLRIPAACNQSLVAMIPFDARIVTPEYLFLSLRYRYHEIRDVTGQDQRRGLNMGLVSDLSVPLAPLAEQKRIVAKVEELMTLCDQLEAQQQERERRFPVLSRTCHTRFAEDPTSLNLNRIFDEVGTVAPADLRRSILSLAVRAKLVQQCPAEESAERLYSRIQNDRKNYSVETRFRASHEEPINEVPYSLPKSWKWARLSSLFNAVTDGDHLPPPRDPEGIAFLTIGNVTTGTLDFDGCRQVPESYFKELTEFRRPHRNDILYTVVGATYGRSALVDTDRPFCVQRHIAILKPSPNMDVGYLLAVLKSSFVYEQASKGITGTAQPTIPLSALRNFLVPLPPLAEQHRIAAKVEEMVGIVGQLEVQQQERDKLAEAFARACLASFTGITQLEKPKKMKAPKTELVSFVTLGKKAKHPAKAPLAQIVSQNMGTLSAKSLWHQSGLTIDAFYQQLKTEIAEGWIAQPAEAEMKVVE